MQDLCIIGVGNLGGSLAIAFSKAGWPVSHLVVRHDNIAKKVKRYLPGHARISQIGKLLSIPERLVLISVDDPEIENVAASINRFTGPDQIVFHTSGALTSSVLEKLSATGARTGSLHPLVSISDPFGGAEQFRDAYFCVEGEPSAVKIGFKLALSLGGKPFTVISERKALYHAAAVTAAGHMTALFDTAVQMMVLSGLDPKRAKEVLLPLAHSAISNLEKQDPDRALTGTFSRLDIQTFQRHLESFENVPGELVHLYLELGARSLDLVERREGQSDILDAFRKAVSVAKQKYRC